VPVSDGAPVHEQIVLLALHVCFLLQLRSLNDLKKIQTTENHREAGQ
jgi:hypothetical protein